MSSLPSVAAPHQRAASTSLAETTEEHVAHHKKEADPRKRRPRRTQGDMKERHDNASKKGNGAHGRRCRRTGSRHGKAFASIFTSPTQAPPHQWPQNSPRRPTSSHTLTITNGKDGPLATLETPSIRRKLLQQAGASALPLEFSTTRIGSGQRRGGGTERREKHSADNEEVTTADVKPHSCFAPTQAIVPPTPHPHVTATRSRPADRLPWLSGVEVTDPATEQTARAVQAGDQPGGGHKPRRRKPAVHATAATHRRRYHCATATDADADADAVKCERAAVARQTAPLPLRRHPSRRCRCLPTAMPPLLAAGLRAIQCRRRSPPPPAATSGRPARSGRSRPGSRRRSCRRRLIGGFLGLREAPPPPSLRPRGFAGGRSGGGEAEL
uniref:Uncharacterized protein n=1 Tax=Oryza nivara TaxID=4536 RepID=A0A0E0I986_ORYNI